MSKIKLTGESSGYVEISAGENAANNTLELPTSGTKIVASDSSNNVNGLGIVTATSFSGALSGTATTATNLADGANITTGTISNDRLPATITKNLTGNVTGNLTGDVTGNVNAGVVTATSSIVVGNSFINATSIGIGTTDTTGRNAGVGTAVGTVIFNTDIGAGVAQIYTSSGWVDIGTNTTFSATGGDTVDTSSRPGWKVHTFTSPGSFEVTSGAGDIEYLITSGGGGGNFNTYTGGGGGAGGVESGTTPVTPGTYAVVRGAGGAAAPSNAFGARGADGTASSVFGISAGVQSDSPSSSYGQTSGNNYGGGANPGGNGAPGGGGAGGDGLDAPGATGGAGGPGVSNSITGTSVTYGGGGGGASENTTTAPGGSGGGGNGARTDINATAGSTNTGGGGGGGRSGYYSGSNRAAAAGGSGIVIIAYPIA